MHFNQVDFNLFFRLKIFLRAEISTNNQHYKISIIASNILWYQQLHYFEKYKSLKKDCLKRFEKKYHLSTVDNVFRWGKCRFLFCLLIKMINCEKKRQRLFPVLKVLEQI